MTTLDDRLLGEKLQNYCSSSESDDELNEDSAEHIPFEKSKDGSCNTGPKGVLTDWEKYKKLERAKKASSEKERVDLLKKLSLSDSANQEEHETETFLEIYRKKRMVEMMSKISHQRTFGNLIDLSTPDDFLNVTDKEDKNVIVLVHIYDNSVSSCKKINNILSALAEEYKHIKFCKLLTSVAGMSINFKVSGVPAFLIYKDKQLVGNFVRITDELGDDFYEGDVENFLIEHGILENKSCFPPILQTLEGSDSDD